MRKATMSLPWIHACADSRSSFFKCPRDSSDFSRLNANSTCQRPRYNSNTTEGLVVRDNVVKTKVYPAASSVSGRACRPFFELSRRIFVRARCAAILFFFRAHTRPGRIWPSCRTKTIQSAIRVPFRVRSFSSNGNRVPSAWVKGMLVRLVRTRTSPPPSTTWPMPARWA